MMLKSFGAQGFRCLEEIEFHNLARVNLIVGDNDSGKTALLEALFAHLTQGNPLMIVRLKQFRGNLGIPDEAFWQEFFTGLDDTKEIHLWSVDSEGVERKSKIAVGETTQVSVSTPAPSGTNEPSGQSGIRTSSYRPLRVEYSSPRMKNPFINEVNFDPVKTGLVLAHPFQPDIRAHYFSTAGAPAAESVAQHFSTLVVTKQTGPLVDLAKRIDDRIQDLTVASMEGNPRVYVDLGEPRLLPLSLLGSGVVRALGIASAIPLYKEGVLLVDEIENGIYHTRLHDFWNAIDHMAKLFNVQIVATTHSAECLTAAIESVTPDLAGADPLHVYKLLRGKRVPIPYERGTLQSALEFMAEVR